MRTVIAFLVSVGLGISAVLVPRPASAHHAPTEFEIQGDKRVELEGELVRVAWQNPHPFFELRAANSHSSTELWRIEVRGALSHLRRAGVSGGLFRQGDSVTIAGVVSSRRERVMMGTNALLSDGTEVLLSAFDVPRWSDSYLGGAQGWEIDEERVQEVVRDGRGFFRVWSFADRTEHNQAFASVASALKPEAYATATTVEQYNQLAEQCEPLSMPFAMMHPVNIEFVDGGDILQLRIGNFEATRRIRIGERSPEGASHKSPMGSSFGRWDSGQLIIETDGITTDFAGLIGMAQSERMRVSERFWLEDGQERLRYEMTMVDPEVFERPAVYAFYYIALGEELGQFECRGD